MKAPSIVRDFGSELARVGSTLAKGLILTPIVIQAFGDEGYGLWKSLETVMMYVAFLDPCIRGSLSRFLAVSLGRSDKSEAAHVIATSATLLIPLTLAFAGIVALFAPAIVSSFDPREASLANDGILAIRILAAASVLSATSAFCGAILQSMKRFDIVNAVGIPFLWISLAISLIVLKYGGGLSAFATIALAQSLTACCITFTLTVKTLRRTKAIDARFLRPRITRDFLRYIANSMVARLGDLLRGNTTTIILGLYVSLDAAAVFAAIDSLRRIAFQNLVALADTSTPRLAQALSDEVAFRKMIASILPIMGAMSAVAATGLTVFGTDFLRLWLGEIAAGKDVPYLVALLATGMFVDGLRMTIQRPLRVRNRVGIIAACSMTEGLLTLGLGILLAGPLGLLGVVAARILIGVLYGALVLPILFAPMAGVPRRDYWLTGMARPLLAAIPIAIACATTLRLVEPENWFTFLLIMIPGGALIAASVFAIGIGSESRRSLRDRLLKRSAT